MPSSAQASACCITLKYTAAVRFEGNHSLRQTSDKPESARLGYPLQPAPCRIAVLFFCLEAERAANETTLRVVSN